MTLGKDHELDAEILFDRFLGDGSDLDTLQAQLQMCAPRWSENLRIRVGPRDFISLELNRPSSLRAGVLAQAGARGSTYEGLKRSLSEPPFERLFGTVELRGSGSELVIVVSVDEMIMSPVGETRQLGNGITLQLRRRSIEGQEGPRWVRFAFEDLCRALSPAWGSAESLDEYWAKVMTDEPPIHARGRDFARFLPGVFWINFFGPPYVELIGADRLLSAPVDRVGKIGEGVLVDLGGLPSDWDTPGRLIVEERFRRHVGEEYFYSKADPERPSKAPRWWV